VAWGARSETVGGGALSWAEYLRSQGWIIPHYLRLVLWPDDLTFDYGMRAVQGFAPTLGLALLSAAGVAAIGAWRWAPWLAFWATWFFLLLAPSSSFVPIQTEIAAERRMHLALAPVLVLLACGFAVALKRARIIPSPRAIAVGAAALVVILAARTAQRSREYNDPERLWAGAIANVPGNPRAYDNLAAVVLAKHPNRFEEPEALWRRAIAIDSTYIPSWTNLADVALQQGRDEEARVLLDRALRIRPDAVDATLRYGGVLVKLGRSAEAIPYLERATAANPTEDGLVTLAIAYLETGRGADAIEPLWRVVRGNPGRLDAAANLGALLAQHGRPSDAIPLLEAVVRVDTTSGGMLALLALSYAQLDRSSEAFSTALRASSRPRLDAPSYEVLGRTMALLHRPADAIQMFGEALRLDPGNTAARDGLAAMRGQPRTR
jgi:protein O-mannosyl-transferase